MERKGRTERDSPQGSKKLRRLLLGSAVFFLMVAVGVVLLIFPSGPFRDRQQETLRIENRTNQELFIYVRRVDGSEVLPPYEPPIPPNTSVETGYVCGAAELVARTRDGRELASRGPFDRCSLEPWIITP